MGNCGPGEDSIADCVYNRMHYSVSINERMSLIERKQPDANAPGCFTCDPGGIRNRGARPLGRSVS